MFICRRRLSQTIPPARGLKKVLSIAKDTNGSDSSGSASSPDKNKIENLILEYFKTTFPTSQPNAREEATRKFLTSKLRASTPIKPLKHTKAPPLADFSALLHKPRTPEQTSGKAATNAAPPRKTTFPHPKVAKVQSKPKALEIQLKPYMSVVQLSQVTKLPVDVLLRQLGNVSKGKVWNKNSMLTEKMQELIVVNNDMLALPSKSSLIEDLLKKRITKGGERRPPVVCIMGHVDHGKTTLLDSLRSTHIAAGEAGGITQRVAAFTVKGTNNSENITVIDTPGHAAFSNMRMRGANTELTDIIILLVAADAGIQPQTIEVAQLAQSSGIPLVVAINKCDLPNVDPSRILQDLAGIGVRTEGFGGDTLAIKISAKTGEGLDSLKEAISFLAELLDFRAPATTPAKAIVLDTKPDREGVIVDAIIREGTLKVGDYVVSGLSSGRVRTLYTDGVKCESAGPSVPVRITGFREAEMGTDIVVVESEEHAKMLVNTRRSAQDRSAVAELAVITAQEKVLQSLGAGAIPNLSRTLRALVKADSQAALDVLLQYFSRLPAGSAEVVKSGIGEVTESDVKFAERLGAGIFAFNSKVSPAASELARRHRVEVHSQDVIYRLMDNVRDALTALVPKKVVQRVLGLALVKVRLNLQGRNKKETLVAAGCLVKEGKLQQNATFSVIRAGKVLHTGACASLKHFKDKVAEIEEGKECALTLEGWQDFEPGDELRCVLSEETSNMVDDSAARGTVLDTTIRAEQVGAMLALQSSRVHEAVSSAAAAEALLKDLDFAPKPTGQTKKKSSQRDDDKDWRRNNDHSDDDHPSSDRRSKKKHGHGRR